MFSFDLKILVGWAEIFNLYRKLFLFATLTLRNDVWNGFLDHPIEFHTWAEIDHQSRSLFKELKQWMHYIQANNLMISWCSGQILFGKFPSLKDIATSYFNFALIWTLLILEIYSWDSGLRFVNFQSVNHDMRLKVYQLRVSQKFWYTTEFKIAWGLKTDIKIIWTSYQKVSYKGGHCKCFNMQCFRQYVLE